MNDHDDGTLVQKEAQLTYNTKLCKESPSMTATCGMRTILFLRGHLVLFGNSIPYPLSSFNIAVFFKKKKQLCQMFSSQESNVIGKLSLSQLCFRNKKEHQTEDSFSHCISLPKNEPSFGSIFLGEFHVTSGQQKT